MIMKKYVIELKWGIAFVVVSLLWMYFEKFMGWHGENIANHATYTNFFAIVAILIYVLALLDKRKNYYGGTMTWKEGFLSGLVISVVITILSPLSQYITHQWITPEYFPNVIRYSVESGYLSQEKAESHFSLGSYILQSAIFGMVAGVVTSSLVALFIRKKPAAATS